MGTDSSYCDNIVVENFGIELLCSKGFSWWILPIVVMKRYMGGLANAGITKRHLIHMPSRQDLFSNKVYIYG